MHTFLLMFLFATVGFSAEEVIYGEDDRKDLFQVQHSERIMAAKSTAALIRSTRLRATRDEHYLVLGPKLKDKGVCENERFSEQTAAAHCTGFLISENLLATAGHCVRSQADCSRSKWVFDYAKNYEGSEKIEVAASSVYSCKKIVKRIVDEKSKKDFALIELDRKASGRRPLKLSSNKMPQSGDGVFVIGHPNGLPIKVAGGAHVRGLYRNYFTANLDTFSGNSGSPVINARTNEVEGILVRGDKDYFEDPLTKCKRNVIRSNRRGRGEDVVYSRFLKHFR